MDYNEDLLNTKATFVGKNYRRPVSNAMLEIHKNEKGEYSFGFIPIEESEARLFGNPQYEVVTGMCIEELKKLGEAMASAISDAISDAEKDSD